MVKFVKNRQKARLTEEEYLARLVANSKNADGSEILDPTPMAPPIGYVKQPSMVEIVRNMVRSERLALAAEEAGLETFEESEDFDVDDELEELSGFENDFDPPIDEVKEAVEEARREADKAREALLPTSQDGA